MIEALKIFFGLFAAAFVQMLLRRHLESFNFLDLHLVAVVYFATYKTRIQSSLIGSAAGLLQDSISGSQLGVNGFTKTLTAYVVAAVCGRLILETFTTQFLLFFMVSLFESIGKLGLFWVFRISLPPRFLPASLLQAFVSAAVGAGVLAGMRVVGRWKQAT